MSLDLFDQNIKDANSYASRHSGASLPTWWELHGNQAMTITVRMVAVTVLLLVLYGVWRSSPSYS